MKKTQMARFFPTMETLSKILTLILYKLETISSISPIEHENLADLSPLSSASSRIRHVSDHISVRNISIPASSPSSSPPLPVVSSSICHLGPDSIPTTTQASPSDRTTVRSQ